MAQMPPKRFRLKRNANKAELGAKILLPPTAALKPAPKNQVLIADSTVQTTPVNNPQTTTRVQFIFPIVIVHLKVMSGPTLRLSGSPTQLNKEARSWRVRSKRVLDLAVRKQSRFTFLYKTTSIPLVPSPSVIVGTASGAIIIFRREVWAASVAVQLYHQLALHSIDLTQPAYGAITCLEGPEKASRLAPRELVDINTEPLARAVA